MIQLPPVVLTAADISTWYALKKQLSDVKASEMVLRLKIFRATFAEPREGTNTALLPDGYQLKGTHTIDRSVVEESFSALSHRPQLADGAYGPCMLEKAGVDPGAIVRWEPKLNTTTYRQLTEEQRHLVDQMLLIKPGSPSLDIAEPPKRRPSEPLPLVPVQP